jgi:hypothetical protein
VAGDDGGDLAVVPVKVRKGVWRRNEQERRRQEVRETLTIDAPIALRTDILEVASK